MVKKFLSLTIIAATFLLGCKKDNMSAEPLPQNDATAFDTYESHFLDALWKIDPDRATLAGYHKYDSLMMIPNDQSRSKLINFSKVQLDSLGRFTPNELPSASKIDHHIMENELNAMQFRIQQLKAYQWDPTSYNVIGTFAYMLHEPYAPLTKRLHSIYQRMSFIPAYYKEAQKQVKNPVAELTALAIDQLQNGVSVLDKDLADSIEKSTLPAAEKKQMQDRNKLSSETIKAFAVWLKALKNDKPHSFRLGKELYENAFNNEVQSQYSAQQVYNAANERAKFAHTDMTKISRQLWPKYFGKTAMPTDSLELIKQLLDTLSVNHVAAGQFRSAVDQQTDKLNTFLQSKDLLSPNAAKPIMVHYQPNYSAGIKPAIFVKPGANEKNGNYYFEVVNISSWSADKAESFLRAYNNYTLPLFCMHNAVPGHYTQAVYAAQSQHMVRSVFKNNAVAEGWAMYAEQMMIDNGFGDNAPETKLMWYKWHLAEVYNMILDHEVHAGAMTKEQALKMLTHDAFEQQTEAEMKWTEVTLTSIQLSCYYTGYKEIMDLRGAYKTKLADKYTLKDFNEKFLNYGYTPIKYIKEAMLEKDKQPASSMSN